MCAGKQLAAPPSNPASTTSAATASTVARHPSSAKPFVDDIALDVAAGERADLLVGLHAGLAQGKEVTQQVPRQGEWVITRQSQGHHIVNHKKRDAAKVNMKKAKKKKRMITVPSSMAIRLFRLLLSIDRSSLALALALALAFIARYPTSFFRLCCDRLKLARRHGYL